MGGLARNIVQRGSSFEEDYGENFSFRRVPDAYNRWGKALADYVDRNPEIREEAGERIKAAVDYLRENKK